MTSVPAGEKKLLAKGWAGRAWGAASAAAFLAVSGGARLPPLPQGAVVSAPGISVVAEGRSERWIVDLDGVLVAALSPEIAGRDEGLLLLVRPPRLPEGPRRLLRLRFDAEPHLELLAEGLGGWIDSLAAIEPTPGSGLELLAGGPGRLVSLGSQAALEGIAKRAAVPVDAAAPSAGNVLLEFPGFDLRSISPGLVRRGVDRQFASVEPGQLHLWRAADEGARAADSTGARPAMPPLPPVPLPFAVERSGAVLRLSSPPVARVQAGSGELYLAGPVAVGNTRLRCFLIDAGQNDGASLPVELWAALPGPESVQQSWAFEIDGVPLLVVRTQAADELNLFERQRLRVLALTPDRTRSGAPPTLAVELDSKRWHETSIALGDVDGDGHDDLLAAFPEGLSGTDLVAQWWRGSGGGRFESRAHRSDIDNGAAGWRLVAGSQAASPPGLLLVGNGRIEWRPFSASGRGALAARADLVASIPALEIPQAGAPAKGSKELTIAVGGNGESAKVRNVDPAAEPLGAVELDGRPGVELLALQGDGNGRDRLILLRGRPE